MATIARVKAEFIGSGATGGGVATFYTSNLAPATFNAGLRAFWAAAGAHIATGTSILFSGTGDLIDEATGEINGSWSAATPAIVVCAGSSNFAAGVGCRVVWSTSGITRGRRVKGSTYVVPLGGNLYDALGGIADGARGAIETAAQTLRLVDSGSMRIYTRPDAASGAVGKSSEVTGASVPDVVSWLRSRRT